MDTPRNDAFITCRIPHELHRRMQRACPGRYRSQFVRNALIAAVVEHERKHANREGTQ